MDQTRRTKRRQYQHQYSAELRAQRAMDCLKWAEQELHQTGDTQSRVLDIAMQDLANTMRRCAAFIRQQQEQKQ